MSNCCITEQDQKEALEGIQVVYQAAASAALSAPQHESVRSAAQKVVATLEKINGTTVDNPLEPVEVVTD